MVLAVPNSAKLGLANVVLGTPGKIKSEKEEDLIFFFFFLQIEYVLDLLFVLSMYEFMTIFLNKILTMNKISPE